MVTNKNSVEDNSFTRLEGFVRDSLKVKEERRAQYEKDKAAREANPLGSKLSRLHMEADTGYIVKFLHEFDLGLDLLVHMWKGVDGKAFSISQLCKDHYNQKCDLCLSTTQYGETKPIPVKCFVGWVYNLVGSTWPKTDKRTGETKHYAHNPLKIIQVPLTNEGANIKALANANKMKGFKSNLWLLERKSGKGGGFQVPEVAEDSAFKEILSGRDIPLAVSDAALKVDALTKKQIYQLVLSAYTDVNYEALGIEPAGQIINTKTQAVTSFLDSVSEQEDEDF